MPTHPVTQTEMQRIVEVQAAKFEKCKELVHQLSEELGDGTWLSTIRLHSQFELIGDIASLQKRACGLGGK